MSTYLMAKTSDATVTKTVTQKTYPQRKGWFVVERLPAAGMPAKNDATGWSDLRTSKGHPAR